jgi:ABC-2 type transport system ATP-binding protein
MSAELAVQTQDLEMTYRELWRKPARALAGVSLEVERGVIFGLLGQNGAGKTTLVKLLLSLIRPTRGTARVLGRDPFDSRTRRRIGYLPEQMRLPEYMKAHSFLRYMGELNGSEGRKSQDERQSEKRTARARPGAESTRKIQS